MKNTLLYISLMLLSLGVCMPADAQVEGSALNYLLQRPRVAKKYKQKQAFDHLFLDAGAGFDIMGRRHPQLGFSSMLTVGDWLTPEHGVRLSFGTGSFRTSGVRAWYGSLGVDYMLNITALAQRGTYYSPRPFEVYGIAGIDLAASHHSATTNYGIGGHVALRGQLALSPHTYFYVEPRFSLVEDQLSFVPTWHGYRPLGTVLLGFGYRLPEQRLRFADPYRRQHSFADGIFVGALAGPTSLLSRNSSTWLDHIGVRTVATVGKWFDPYNAVRLSFAATTARPDGMHRVKGVGAQLDYMVNLHNAFGGVNPDRRFWLDGVLGFSLNRTADDQHQRRNSWGFGGGLQANVRLSRDINFVVEPRVDLYGSKFIPRFNTFRQYDVAASVLAGLVYTYHDSYSLSRRSSGEHGVRRASFSIAGGLAAPANKLNKSKYYMPSFALGYTTWSSAAQGARLSLNGDLRGLADGTRYGKMSLGVDWLVDLSALTYGTSASPLLSFRTVAGFALGAEYSDRRSYFAPDVHAGAQARLRLSSNVGVFAEPQLAYNMSKRLEGQRWGRVTPRMLVGIDYTMQRQRSANSYDAPEKKHFVSISAGMGVYTGNFGEVQRSDKYVYSVNVSYGQWLSGLHGFYASAANNFVTRQSDQTDNLTTVTAGYMLNLKSAVSGESSDDDVLQITGKLGASLGINSGDGHSVRLAPGINAAMQAGFRVSPAVELFVEPSATVFTKHIEPRTGRHPAEGELKISVGTKFNF